MSPFFFFLNKEHVFQLFIVSLTARAEGLSLLSLSCGPGRVQEARPKNFESSLELGPPENSHASLSLRGLWQILRCSADLLLWSWLPGGWLH